jgi:heme/copper-type cytochrome/quinol oxidase subunit 2
MRRAGRSFLRRWAGPAALGALLLALPSLALACPTCKDALEANPAGIAFGRGIYLSILLMLGVLFSAVGFFIYKLVRLARQEQEPPAPTPSPRA